LSETDAEELSGGKPFVGGVFRETRGEMWEPPRRKTEHLDAAMTSQTQNQEELSRIQFQPIRQSNTRASTGTGGGEREFKLSKFGGEPAIESQVKNAFPIGSKIWAESFLEFSGISGVLIFV